MRTRAKLLLATLVAATTLAALVGSASANTLSFSNKDWRITWSPITFIVGGVEIRCNLTFEGGAHSTSIAKVASNLIGYITRAIIPAGPCEGGGDAWMLVGEEEIEVLRVIPPTTLPWHIRYRSFAGTLPNIAAVTIDIIDVSFMLRIMELLCLYRSTAAGPARFRFNVNGARQLTGLQADETAGIPKFAGNILCPATATLRGTGNVRLLGTTTTLVFIALI